MNLNRRFEQKMQSKFLPFLLIRRAKKLRFLKERSENHVDVSHVMCVTTERIHFKLTHNFFVKLWSNDSLCYCCNRKWYKNKFRFKKIHKNSIRCEDNVDLLFWSEHRICSSWTDGGSEFLLRYVEKIAWKNLIHENAKWWKHPTHTTLYILQFLSKDHCPSPFLLAWSCTISCSSVWKKGTHRKKLFKCQWSQGKIVATLNNIPL